MLLHIGVVDAGWYWRCILQCDVHFNIYSSTNMCHFLEVYLRIDKVVEFFTIQNCKPNWHLKLSFLIELKPLLNAVTWTVSLLGGVYYLCQESILIRILVFIPSWMSCYGWMSLLQLIFIFLFLLVMYLQIFETDIYFLKWEAIIWSEAFLSNMTLLLGKIFVYLNNWGTVSPNTYFVAMATLHSGTTAKAIEDKLPICHMLPRLPYVLISDTRFMCSYGQQLKYYVFVLRCRFISPMTCLFTNICLINLLPWLKRSCPNRLYQVPFPQYRTAANWPAGDRINLWIRDKIYRSNNLSEFKCVRWLL